MMKEQQSLLSKVFNVPDFWAVNLKEEVNYFSNLQGGTVVNIASILGLFNTTQPKGFHYNTSKSAVVTLTRCIGNKVKNVIIFQV